MKEYEVEYPALLYLPPDMSPHLSFATWKYAKQFQLIVQVIPKSVWRDMHSLHLGVFRKLKPKFKHIAFKE